jgi:hypothetical protein
MALSSLDVIWSTRVGGGGRTERRYLDLIIDGVPLSTRLGADLISPFDEDIIHRTGFEAIGPFEFDGSMYHQLWERVCRSIEGGARRRLT